MPIALRSAVTVVSMLAFFSVASAETLDRPHPRIVNGVLSAGYPSAGALLRGATPDSASAWCSGTLIGCATFLTAGHCVDGLAPSDFFVFLPNAGIFPVVAIAQHPSFDFPAGDVAVLKLGIAVTGVAPTAIASSAAPAFGASGVIVGYGRSGDPNFDYGLKRAGDVTTAACSTIPPPGSDTTSVCWNFTSPQGPPGTNANTCNADSGGPLFVDFGGGLRVAGVTSGGSSSSCLPDDHSYDANVFTYRSFIQTQGGADLSNTSCGSGPQVGEVGTTVLATAGIVSSGSPQGTYAFPVGSGTTLIRVAMNAVDDGVSDFDLYVKAGSPPSTTIYDCRRIGSNQFAVCEFPAPLTGTWYALVQRYSGAGTYQLTVTEYATDCAGPGSDGTSCDDHDACTGGDVCQSGTCAGTPVVDGTECDDANTCTAPDTCESGTCIGTPVANGTPCDDDDACSRPDTCQAGTCVGASPAVGCKSTAPNGAYLLLDDRSSDTRDHLSWSWRKGAATTLADLGNPTTATPYTLCLYDTVGGVPQRRLTQSIAPGPHWKPFSRGFRYRDSTLAAGGIQSVVLTEGVTGRASIQVQGRGQPLALPSLPLQRQPNVIVQLLNANTCWSATYSTVVENSPARFKAKGN
jgi:hypothetical protein